MTTVARLDDSSPEPEARPATVEQNATPPVVHDPVPLQRAAADGTPLPLLPAPSPEPVVAPLVAQRSMPLFSGAEAPLGDAPASPLDAARPAVPVQWTAPGPPDTGRPQTTDAGAPGNGSPPLVPTAVQRTVTAMPVGSLTPPPRSTAAAPQVQRTAAGVPSSATAGPTAVSTAAVDAGAVAVAAGVAQRMADGSVVFQSPTVQRDADTSPPATDTAGEPPPATDTPAEPAEPADPPPEPEPVPDPDRGPDPADQPGPSDVHGPQGAHPGEGGAPKVTDELVRALFAPLSRMLKAELRLDRERAGFLIDTRH